MNDSDGKLHDNHEELFFFGRFVHSVDQQCRVAIPREWRCRESRDTNLILFPGRDNDLLLFPFEVFREFLLKARKMALANREVQQALAKLGSMARECRCDAQGRIKLSPEMLEKINVSDQLCMIGAMTHIKLCDPEHWDDGGNTDSWLDELQQISESESDSSALFREIMRK